MKKLIFIIILTFLGPNVLATVDATTGSSIGQQGDDGLQLARRRKRKKKKRKKKKRKKKGKSSSRKRGKGNPIYSAMSFGLRVGNYYSLSNSDGNAPLVIAYGADFALPLTGNINTGLGFNYYGLSTETETASSSVTDMRISMPIDYHIDIGSDMSLALGVRTAYVMQSVSTSIYIEALNYSDTFVFNVNSIALTPQFSLNMMAGPVIIGLQMGISMRLYTFSAATPTEDTETDTTADTATDTTTDTETDTTTETTVEASTPKVLHTFLTFAYVF